MRKPPRSFAFSAEQVAEMVAIYKHGWSCARIAGRFGCLPWSIQQRLVAAGVTMRSQHLMRRTAKINSNGYVKWGSRYVHRIVAEAMLERPLRSGESVHHVDGDKTNNHPDNLQVFASHGDHMRAETWRTWWTAERDSALARMRAGGARSSDIAVALSTTKYAVDNHIRDLIANGTMRRMSRHEAGRVARSWKLRHSTALAVLESV